MQVYSSTQGLAVSESKPGISIIIKTYDDRVARTADSRLPPLRDVLIDTLDALCSQSITPVEVIIVDSSNGTGIEEAIAEFQATCPISETYELIHHPLPPEEFTYTHALNVGIAIAKGDLLVSLSGDATPANEIWLEELTKPFADAKVAGAYSRHIARPAMRLSFAERLRLWWRYRSKKTVIRQHDHVFSNASSCIRSNLMDIFPFDENLKELEDYAWAKEVQNAGYSIVYTGRSEVHHSHDNKTLKTLQRMLYYFWLRLKTDAG